MKLEACPWCNGEAVLVCETKESRWPNEVEVKVFSYVFCGSCPLRIKREEQTKEEAVVIWNDMTCGLS